MQRGGLANLGNTCYFNSVLQGLASCGSFVPTVAKLSLAPNAGLSRLLLPLLQPNREEIKPFELKQLKQELGEKNELFAGDGQQDAHELLCELLQAIDAEAKAAVPASQPLTDGNGTLASDHWPCCKPFGFMEATHLRCQTCDHRWQTRPVPANHLALSLPAHAPPAAPSPHAVQPEGGMGGGNLSYADVARPRGPHSDEAEDAALAAAIAASLETAAPAPVSTSTVSRA